MVSPETLLRWHRDLFKIVWRRESRTRGQPKRLAPEIVTLILAMAKDNLLWGAERIRACAHVDGKGSQHGDNRPEPIVFPDSFSS